MICETFPVSHISINHEIGIWSIYLEIMLHEEFKYEEKNCHWNKNLVKIDLWFKSWFNAKSYSQNAFTDEGFSKVYNHHFSKHYSFFAKSSISHWCWIFSFKFQSSWEGPTNRLQSQASCFAKRCGMSILSSLRKKILFLRSSTGQYVRWMSRLKPDETCPAE